MVNMKSTTTLFLAALGSIATAAAASDITEASSTEIEGVPRVFHQPDVADDVDQRELLSNDNSCFIFRFNGDSKANTENSFKFEDWTDRTTLLQRNVGQLQANTQEDFDCIRPTRGHILKLTVNDSGGGYEPDHFHAFFIGGMRVDRLDGSWGTQHVHCFRMSSSDPYFQNLDRSECGEGGSGSSSGPANIVENYVLIEQRNPSPTPYVPTPTFVSTMGCSSGQKKVKIVFRGDKYIENWWKVVKKSTNAQVFRSKDYQSECNSGNWQSCNRETKEVCLPEDDYQIVFYDGIGDMPPGFELHMEKPGGGYERMWGNPFVGKEWTLHFHTKPVQLRQREKEWLDAHNVRRQKYWYDNNLRLHCPKYLEDGSVSCHCGGRNCVDEDGKKSGWEGSIPEERGVTNPSYRPMRWDHILAEQAAEYALELLDDCEGQYADKMFHDPNRGGKGENMAKNRANFPSHPLSKQPTADSVCNRFTEMEFDLSYGNRYHMTQLLWLGSLYVGCGEAFKTYTINGQQKQCHTQVCRYVGPGNCAVNGDSGSSDYDLKRINLEPEQQNCGDRFPDLGFYAVEY